MNLTESDVKNLARLSMENPEKLVAAMFLNEKNTPLILTEYQARQLKELLKAILTQKRSKFAFVQATRSGKSELISCFVSLALMAFPSIKVATISYTEQQAKIIFERVKAHLVSDNEFVQELVNLDRSMVSRKEFSKSRMFMKNGAEYRLFSTGKGETEMTGENMLGFGADIAIIDEAGSISDFVNRTKIQRMTADARRETMIIYSGTPHRRNFFFNAWNDDSFVKFHVDWKQAVAAGQISQEAIDDARRDLTEREFSMWYGAEFSGDDDEQLIKWDWINAAKRELLDPKETPTCILGVDVARHGKDRTVFCYIQKFGSLVILKAVKWYERKDTMATVGNIRHFLEDQKVNRIVVDDTGIGGGVVDRLKEIENMPLIVPFIAAGLPFNEQFLRRKLFEKERVANTKFLNRKAYCYNRLAWHFEKKLIIMPPFRLMEEQLASIKAEYGSDAKIRIVDEKQQGKSPDFADALMMAVSGFDYQELIFDFGESIARENPA